MPLSVEDQFNHMAGEVLSVQLLIVRICRNLAKIDSAHLAAISAAFDDAASDAESFAIQLGKTAAPEHTIKAGRIIEQFRTAAFRDEN